MAAPRYLPAEVAIVKTINNSDDPNIDRVPRRMKWPAVKKVLKSKVQIPANDLDSFRLELRTPDFHSNLVPLYHCFTDSENLVKLLNELNRKDSDLATYLEVSGNQEDINKNLDEDDIVKSETSPGPRVSVDSYVDFISTFVSLFIQSRFLADHEVISTTEDRHAVISMLASHHCPEDMLIFRRVYVNPHQVANDLSDGETPELYNGTPVNHLAKFLDIAVLRFLSTVTEHTSPSAVEWALDYLLRLLHSLQISLTSLTSFGWYGAPPIRSRKGTTTSRHSITHPFIVPPMVVVGTPPTSPPSGTDAFSSHVGPVSLLDPDTGQQSPLPSPNLSPNPSPRGSRTSPRPASPSSPRIPHSPLLNGQLVPQTTSPQQSSSLAMTHNASLSKTGGNADHGKFTRGRRTSRQEILRPPSSRSMLSEYSSTSLHSFDGSVAGADSLPLQHSLLSSLPSPTMVNIPEERGATLMEPTETEYFESFKSDASVPVLFTGPSRMSEIDNQIHVRPTRSDSRAKSPRGVTPPTLDSIQEDSETVIDDPSRSYSMTPPLEVSYLTPEQPRQSPGPDEDEVRSKMKSPEIPQVDLQRELETLMNGEGRISLIAILHAIARLPQAEILWTTQVGKKCLSLIQICLDLGLPPKHLDATQAKAGTSAHAQDRRKKFQAKDNLAFAKHGNDKPSVVHVQYIVEYSVNALIQCSTSLMVGCTNDSHLCPLRYTHLPNYETHSFHNKVIRLLTRINDRSSATFRQTLTNFAQPSSSSARKLFHFLHVALQYCSQCNEHYGGNNLVVDIVVAVLRTVVDRLVELDITEQSIQNTIVSEACTFFQYARNTLSEGSLAQVHGSQHLKMYFHRIALSIVLPPRPKVELPQIPSDSLMGDAASPLITRGMQGPGINNAANYTLDSTVSPKVRTMPAQKRSHIAAIAAVQEPQRGLGPRTRSGSLNIPSTSSTAEGSPSGYPKSGGGKGRRNPIRKQQSLHSDIGRQGSRQNSSNSMSEPSPLLGPRSSGASGESFSDASGIEWKGLRLDILRSRIQRLVVLMNTSVPGTVPNSDMLASLIDLGDGKTVVARSMVLLECAMFVSKLRNQDLPSVWVIHNKETNAHLMHSVSHNLNRWGEAIGEKLRLIELKERETLNRLRFSTNGDKSATSFMLSEEPVFPVDHEQMNDSKASEEHTKGEMYQAVSYAVKMSACMLLLEITRFLRDPPPHFCAPSVSQISTPRVSTTLLDPDRRPSISSCNSTDTESVKGGYASLPNKEFFSSQSPKIGRFGSNLSVEDAEPPTFKHSMSIEESGSPSPRKKRTSVYLRVNSTGGTISRTNSLKRPTKLIRVTDSPGTIRSNIQGSPTVRSRRKTMISSPATALHQSMYTGHRGARRPSVVGPPSSISVSHLHPLPIKYRRKSVGAPLFKPASLSEADHHVTLSDAVTGGSSKAAGAGIGSSLNVGLTKLKRAFTKRRVTKSRPPTESGLSPGGSPSHRKTFATGHRISPTSSFHLQHCEDKGYHCQWLNIVEHLIVVECSLPPRVRQRHSLSCRGLIVALKKVYSATYDEEEDEESTRASSTFSPSRSISMMFTPRLSLKKKTEGNSVAASYRRGLSLPDTVSHRRSRKSNVFDSSKRSTSMPFNSVNSLAGSSQGSSSPFTSLNFSRMSYNQFPTTFLGAVNHRNEESIELFLEAESAYPRSYLNAELDNQRKEYVTSELLGMIHVPFSILLHAAPILHPSTLSNLKVLAWDSLLDRDTELSQTAAAFFLVACSKEHSTTIKGFIKEKVIKESPEKQREAIQRFKVLWDARYHVWPRMEERAPKKLCLNESEENSKNPRDENTIGYSLPANLLGQPGDTLPLPPWESSSVCTNKTCEENPNLCYRSTRHVPVVHGDEVTKMVQDFDVTGVSLVQEASNKPANVFIGIEADDDTGNVEKWEAVKTTLFPRSLLPLVRFVIMALTPHSAPSTSKPSSQPHTSTSSQRHPSTASQDTYNGIAQIDMCELARQVVWTCMLEDGYLFFRPLLNQFNPLYKIISEDKKKSSADIEKLLAEILEPLHILIQTFDRLPSQAAHYLFNNFIGVIMKHTDQPLVHSGRIIQSVLTLVGMVAPSVKGLDSKLLKSILKKENCYTTVMTTARIRGVERVYVTDLSQMEPTKRYVVTEEMTFGSLVAQACKRDHVSLDLLNNWYLHDEGKDVPVLSSLVIQDHYSAPLDNKYLEFALKGAIRSDRLWAGQMDQMFVFKMSEMMRVLFTTQLLHTGPEVEKGVAYSEYAQPNYRFIRNELVELNSFPRKALTNILQEAGQGGLQHTYLHASDIMLKGMWVRFVLQLFKSVKPDYNWSNSMILFLNVISGSLLLHSENHTILRYCLATLLTAATKFKSAFKRDGYQMILPTLFQVYALHIQNKLITDALKFLWFHFYLLDGNTFISQVAASASTLFSENVASLSSKVSSSYTTLSSSLLHLQGEEAKRYQVRAVFELTCTLDMNLPDDDLDVMLCCQQCLNEADFSRLNSDNSQRLSLQNVAALLITLATWMPGALRGMQVLVCIDHIMPHILKSFVATNPQSVLKSVEYLIKGCESITRPHSWRDNIKGAGKSGRSSGAANPAVPASKPFKFTETDDSTGPGDKRPVPSVARKVSVVLQQRFRRLINPNKMDLNEQKNGLERSLQEDDANRLETPGARSVAHGIDYGVITNQFKLRRLQYENQQVLQLARDSLLSIATQFVSHYSDAKHSEGVVTKGTSVTISRKVSNTIVSGGGVKQERSKVILDPNSISVLTFITIQLIKLGYTNENVLQGKGLIGFMTCLLPNVEWSEAYFSSFQALLNRLLKFFKYLQKETNKALMVWETLTAFIAGITATVHRSPQLVQGQEQHLQKLKILLETIVNLHHAGAGNPHHQSASALKRWKSIQTPLLQCAPVSFSEAIVGLAVELIVLTHSIPQQKFRYHMSDLLYHKIIKDHEEILMAKIVLPLCTQLGLRDDMARPCSRDAEFILNYIDNNVEFVLKVKNPKIMSQKLPPDTFFKVLTVVCCSFSETFSLHHWHKISQWVISLTQRKSLPSVSSKVSVTSTDSNISSATRTSRLSSVSSSSGHTGSSVSLLESFLTFHECLLGFFESFLVICQVPLLSMLWPVLRLQETQMQVTLQGVKSDIPIQFERVNNCIERCQQLLSSSFNSAASESKHQLLQKVHKDLRHMAVPSRSQIYRTKTSVVGERPHFIPLKKTRRSSYGAFAGPLSKIGEEDSVDDTLMKSTTLPNRIKLSRKHGSPDHRPKSLKLHGRSLSDAYVPPRVKPSVKTSMTDTVSRTDTLSANTRSPRKKRRSPSPRRPPSSTLSPEDDGRPHHTSQPRKKQWRAPKLESSGKFFGSSECHADIEDAEDLFSQEDEIHGVSGRRQYAVTNPGLGTSEEYIIENMASLSAENSPRPPPKKSTPRYQQRQTIGTVGDGQVLVVPVEIHENNATLHEDSHLEPSLASVDEHPTLYEVNSNDSANSGTLLLLHSETESGANEGQVEVESTAYRNVVQDPSDETDVLIEATTVPTKSSLSTVPRRNSKQEKPIRKVSFSDERKTSLSLDRRGNFMSSALKESSKFLYTSLEDNRNED